MFFSVMASQATQQYRMMLNTIEQAGHAKLEFKVDSSGPPATPQWRAVVTVTSVSPPLSASIPVGTACEAIGGTKSTAKDAASQKMLTLFAASGILPRLGH